MIPGFCHSVIELFALVGCYEAQIDSCQCFGTTYWSHHEGDLVEVGTNKLS